jgi:oligopeptidase B
MATTGQGDSTRPKSNAALVQPPVALRIPHTIKIGKVPGEPERGADDSLLMDPPIEWTDDLFWLRDDHRQNKDVLQHLEAENRYTDAQTAHLEGTCQHLFEKMRSRIKESDHDFPQRQGRFYYYTRTQEGQPFKIHCRALTKEMVRPPALWT